jgi:hypothetical protein
MGGGGYIIWDRLSQEHTWWIGFVADRFKMAIRFNPIHFKADRFKSAICLIHRYV